MLEYACSEVRTYICMLEPLCHPLQRVTGVANSKVKKVTMLWGKDLRCGMDAYHTASHRRSCDAEYVRYVCMRACGVRVRSDHVALQ